MEITIIEEIKETDTFRTSYKGTVSYPESKTPSRDEITKKFAKKTGSKIELISVKDVTPLFGKSTSELLIYVYDSAVHMKKLEPSYVAKRNVAPVVEKKKEEAPKPVEEAPAETPAKEEPKVEEAPKEVAKPEEKPEAATPPEEAPKVEAKPEEKSE